jgi:hypothetical protein
MLWPTVSRPVWLGIKHRLGLTTRFLLRWDSCGFVDVGRSLWREDESVIYNCCWYSPAQSFPGPSPVGIVIIFYCLRFETSLAGASYDSQGHGEGIRPRLHTGHEWIEITNELLFITARELPPRVLLLLFMNALSRKPCVNSEATANVHNFQFSYPWKPCSVTDWFSRISLSVATYLQISFLETAHMSQ